MPAGGVLASALGCGASRSGRVDIMVAYAKVAADEGGENHARRQQRQRGTIAGSKRFLEPGAILFQQGDTHAKLYRVDDGALCHYWYRNDGSHEIIEFAYAGDIVGFGPLATHVSTARAVTTTELSHVTPHEFNRALDLDGQLAARVAAAADRELEHLRTRTVRLTRNKPVLRLASLLLALSRLNSAEGRDPTFIPDAVPSEFLADRLRITVDELDDAFDALEDEGLVELTSAGLRIFNVVELVQFADSAK